MAEQSAAAPVAQYLCVPMLLPGGRREPRGYDVRVVRASGSADQQRRHRIGRVPLRDIAREVKEAPGRAAGVTEPLHVECREKCPTINVSMVCPAALKSRVFQDALTEGADLSTPCRSGPRWTSARAVALRGRHRYGYGSAASRRSA